jgi:SNF2 family DNA or RNA helicase
MRIEEIRNGFLILEGGPFPSYCSKLRNGKGVCHWSFFPRLWHEADDEIEISEEVKQDVRVLAAERREILTSKDSDGYDEIGIRPLFGDEKPFDYQYRGIEFLLTAKAVLLADDVGLGKTIQSIGVILHGFEMQEIRRVIILCPSSVKFQWRDEIVRFASSEEFPDLPQEIQVIHGDAKKRERQYAGDWSIAIMTYNVFLRDAKKLEAFREEIDCAILDEANAIKNRSTKTAQGVKKYFRDATYRLALTATPIENRLHDLYSICEWLDLTIFPGMKWFESEYCKIITLKVKRGRYMIQVPKVVGYKNLEDAKKRTAHTYIRRTFKEVGAQLPEVVSSNLRLELSKPQRELYNRLAKELSNAKHDDEDKLKIMGQLVKFREICDSSGLIEGKHASSKLDELKRILEDLPPDEKVVIFSEFRKMTDEIVRVLKKFKPLYINGGTEDVQRQLIRKNFETTSSQIMVMTGAGERGLNLQVAGILVNFELPYNPARLKQRIGRIWRIGSKHETVRVINMLTIDTFEERVLDVLERKEKLFDAIFEPDGIDRIGDPVSKLSTSQLLRLV